MTNDPKMAVKTTREKLRELCECDKVISDAEVYAFGRINRDTVDADDNAMCSSSSSGGSDDDDEVDEILEAEYRRLNDALELPVDTYSLTRIRPNLPTSVKYGVRSGITNMRMQKFSPLSRGLQGPAIAIAAFATTALTKARCWNETTIDQIVDDGDTYYCKSYNNLKTDDRRTLKVQDLQNHLTVQNTHRVDITIDEPVYAGTFRSDTPTDLHLAKALELFFKRHNAGVLTSAILNIAMWKDSHYINIFDGQPRRDNLLPINDPNGGSAKLILVRDLIGLIFIILQKSNVNNEHFVIHGLEIRGSNRLSGHEDDPEEPEKTIGKPTRRPSGYVIQNNYRALIQGSFHLMHELVPDVLRGHGHLVIALAALIYSRLINANKWTTAIVDLIINQSHIYLVDLARVLEKKLDETFELKIDDVMGDVVLGVYTAKVKVTVNVIPGQGKKGKATIVSGFRDFFATEKMAIVEIKKKFYAVWMEGGKYYLMDPFACDGEGFRVDPGDPEDVARYEKARACVTMNSTINELVETILENTGNKEKDPFVMHGLKVLYVKTGSLIDGSKETVIYREKKTNRRPIAVQEAIKPIDDCRIVIDTNPRPRDNAEKIKDGFNQYPELMIRVEDYEMKDDEPVTFVESKSDSHSKTSSSTAGQQRKNRKFDSTKVNIVGHRNQENPEVQIVEQEMNQDKITGIENEPLNDEEVKFIKGYKIINPHRLILHGSMNCLAEEFAEISRGRQGLIVALTAMAYSKIKNPAKWRNLDVDQILRVGNLAHSDVVTWIRQGSPDADAGEPQDRENEEDDEEDVEEDAKDDAEGVKKNFKGVLKPVPSHIDVSMIPDKIKLGENLITHKTKKRVMKGDADPLANLGEALEHCFDKYEQLILENKSLMYGIWKQDDKYLLLNPYGSDEEGWRLRDYPACVLVTDTINELTDILHGILEFNDRMFFLHFVGIESIQPGDKYVAPIVVDRNDDDIVETYRTKFLPVTDQDLIVSQLESQVSAQTTEVEEQEVIQGGNVEDNEDEDDEGDEEDGEEEDNQDNNDVENLAKDELEPEQLLEDPLLEISEQERPEAPNHLNLALLTGGVKIEKDELPNEQLQETIAYERLKYNHPPPYVLPPKKVLCLLLEAKKASRSMHSLISRFSIDSKLAVKAITDLPIGQTIDRAAIKTVNPISNNHDDDKPAKMIKLPPTKYLFSRIPPEGYTPLRAIDENFIHDEISDRTNEQDCRKKRMERFKTDEFSRQDIFDDSNDVQAIPTIIPLGPTIKTPTPKKKFKSCVENSTARRCKINDAEKQDKILNEILCNTENLLFDVIFPIVRRTNVIDDNDDSTDEKINDDDAHKNARIVDSTVRVQVRDNEETRDRELPEFPGFRETDKNIGIIRADTCLRNRDHAESCHLKTCFYAAILSILAKVRTDVNNLRGEFLNELIEASKEINRRTGNLRYKNVRRFDNVVFHGVKCNVILKQTLYADPQICDTDDLSSTLRNYVIDDKTGILVLENASYAFWMRNNDCYMFDAYGCDDKGVASDENGSACLLKFCSIDEMIARIVENNSASTNKPYRIYKLSIAHIESMTTKKKPKRKRERCIDDRDDRESEKSVDEDSPEDTELVDEDDRSKREISLMELSEWVNDDEELRDLTLDRFQAIKNYEASAMEVIVVENDITRPILAPFRKSKRVLRTESARVADPVRKRPYDRKFGNSSRLNSCIDLCVIAWSCVHDPASWGVRTVKGIYEASKDLAHDSLLAAKDFTVANMTDGVLPEFHIANYHFHAVFAPLHNGILYNSEGWNLAMSLKKLFDITIYTGATIVCENSHVGVMKKGRNYYAWWTVKKTKKLRIITTEFLEDYLRLVVKALGESDEKRFFMRIVTISYAKKVDPDCSDVDGLHEIGTFGTSLPQIHRKSGADYDLDAIFRSTTPHGKPIFVVGNVAFRNRDVITEPRMKRCYLVGVIATMIKRDIVQSPVPSMIDKIIQVAENLYKQIDDPKFHTEHLLRNIRIMNRTFDFRDCAGSSFVFKENSNTGKIDCFSLLRKQLKLHLKKHDHGLIQFTNCCYGFWYSCTTNAYYYIDPYSCNANGRRSENSGKACLGIFPSICQMTRHMCANSFKDTTGFFIHRIHVESINVPPFEKFQEDPMWIYLDYHWNFRNSLNRENSREKCKKRRDKRKNEKFDDCTNLENLKKWKKSSWNNYTIEVKNLIYSVWGTLGCYDTRFGNRAGKNRNAICIAVMAMRYLCHPSKWGPAILDSAIICGDSYYTESMKYRQRKDIEDSSNMFDLKPCFKIFPHLWSIKFLANMCGIIYGTRNKPCLATILKRAFERSSSVVVECGKVSIAVLSCEDGFYVVDPCWTGPPLFFKNHGAVYGLRCKNYNSTIYAIAKIFNTNQRLEFRVTPVEFGFSHESCEFVDRRERRTTMGREILVDAAGFRPGTADGPDVDAAGALAVRNHDAHASCRRNIPESLLRGNKIRDPTISSPFPGFDDRDVKNLISKSTAWHLNVGRSSRRKRFYSSQQKSMTDLANREFCRQTFSCDNGPRKIRSIVEKIQVCDDYPRTIDFVDVSNTTKTSTKILTRKEIAKTDSLSLPIDCVARKNFLQDSGRREFKKGVKEMADDFYKTYKHRGTMETVGRNDDGEESADSDVKNANENVEEMMATVKSKIANDIDE